MFVLGCGVLGEILGSPLGGHSSGIWGSTLLTADELYRYLGSGVSMRIPPLEPAGEVDSPSPWPGVSVRESEADGFAENLPLSPVLLVMELGSL